MRDSLDYEEPDTFDPRLNFRSLSLNSTGYEDLENSTHFERPFSSSSNQAAIIDRDRDRKKRRQREHDAQLEDLPDYCFRTVADGDLFRLVVLLPGSAADVVQCRLLWESSRRPERPYRCLSYCWETRERDAEIVVDGARFAVTGNLLMALKSLRRSTKELLIWM